MKSGFIGDDVHTVLFLQGDVLELPSGQLLQLSIEARTKVVTRKLPSLFGFQGLGWTNYNVSQSFRFIGMNRGFGFIDLSNRATYTGLALCRDFSVLICLIGCYSIESLLNLSLCKFILLNPIEPKLAVMTKAKAKAKVIAIVSLVIQMLHIVNHRDGCCT